MIYLPDATAREAKKQRKYKDGNIYTFQQNFWILFLWFLQTKGFVYVRPIIFSCIYWHIRQITCMNKNMIRFYWLPFFPFSVLDWGPILCKWWWNVRKWNIMSELRIYNFFVRKMIVFYEHFWSYSFFYAFQNYWESKNRINGEWYPFLFWIMGKILICSMFFFHLISQPSCIWHIS